MYYACPPLVHGVSLELGETRDEVKMRKFDTLEWNGVEAASRALDLMVCNSVEQKFVCFHLGLFLTKWEIST